MTDSAKHRFRAVLFDFDGTLTAPGALDFPAIRLALNCPAGLPILEFLQRMSDSEQRRGLMQRLDQLEMEAAARSQPNEGAEELLAWLQGRRLPMGILTRNSRASVVRALQNFTAAGDGDFAVIVTRDDPVRPKPSGEGVLYAARKMGLGIEQLVVVGDFLFDCQAGRAAGAATVLLDPDGDARLRDAPCDWRIQRLAELKALLIEG